MTVRVVFFISDMFVQFFLAFNITIQRKLKFILSFGHIFFYLDFVILDILRNKLIDIINQTLEFFLSFVTFQNKNHVW